MKKYINNKKNLYHDEDKAHGDRNQYVSADFYVCEGHKFQNCYSDMQQQHTRKFLH